MSEISEVQDFTPPTEVDTTAESTQLNTLSIIGLELNNDTTAQKEPDLVKMDKPDKPGKFEKPGHKPEKPQNLDFSDPFQKQGVTERMRLDATSLAAKHLNSQMKKDGFSQEERSEAAAIQKAIIRGNPEKLAQAFSELEGDQAERYVEAINENLSNLDSRVQLSIDENGSLVVTSSKHSQAIEVTSDGEVDVVEKGYDRNGNMYFSERNYADENADQSLSAIGDLGVANMRYSKPNHPIKGRLKPLAK